MEGAAVMGAGFATQKPIHVRGGRCFPAGLAAGWTGYRAILAHEAPRVQVQLVDGGRLDAQGAGKIGLPLVAPAAANALVRLGRPRPLALPLAWTRWKAAESVLTRETRPCRYRSTMPPWPASSRA